MKLDFRDINVLLIGDFMIDYYIMGTSKRISPEAPVPVVTPEKEYSIPGGAGNVAMNLSSLGANVTCVGIIGDDKWGKKLLKKLNEQKINIENMIIKKNHCTTVKQRIYSDGKQVARLDKEQICELEESLLTNKIDDYDIYIYSDYNKGVIEKVNEHNNIVVVDPKKDDFSIYKNANIITPNLNELQRATDIKLIDNESIVEACNKLIINNNFDFIVAKKGDQGITIVGKDNYFKHFKAYNVNNPDVTGAGDTVISALSLAYCKSQDIEFSVKFAIIAAANVVGKVGTDTTTINEIENLIT